MLTTKKSGQRHLFWLASSIPFGYNRTAKVVIIHGLTKYPLNIFRSITTKKISSDFQLNHNNKIR